MFVSVRRPVVVRVLAASEVFRRQTTTARSPSRRPQHIHRATQTPSLQCAPPAAQVRLGSDPALRQIDTRLTAPTPARLPVR